ncbi:hypothetical protein NG895_07050 [Aeoliella sp. ICT_H6.2]|uniref:Sulfotransferase family protein n=1 Tax=Aeoliella straminimaris TaxID=2954799 RepID=A0A9X2JF41_9BACT|nr:hypothetical protein [Aeoliella straminimaris]MCO6043660.1 hypothetical protein [Aeoliella straminimaris]
MKRIIALWAHPRSRSTALERVFMERGDFHVIHEPFAALYYLHEQRAAAVEAELDTSQPSDFTAIRDRILNHSQTSNVFFKDMCYHCHDHLIDDKTMLEKVDHVFLVRDPKPTIASHFAKNPDVTMEEIGYERQASLFDVVHRVEGSPPIVVCAETLVAEPTLILSELCQRLGIPHYPEAIRWSSGQQEEWKDWQSWHEGVADSQGLSRQHTRYDRTVDNDQALARFYQYHLPFYRHMYRYRI